MKNRLSITIICLLLSILLLSAAGCQPQAKPEAAGQGGAAQPATLVPTPTPEPQPRSDEIVLAAMEGWNSDQVNASQIDETLAYFAEEATFKMVGFPPEVPADFTGKDAIRAAYESWLPLHPKLEVTIQKVEGDTVTALTRYWSDPTRGMGIAPLEGIDVYIIRDGKIASEVWTLTDESREKFQVAFAAAMAPTPTPNSYLAMIAGTYETELTKEDLPPGAGLAGTWKIRFTENGVGAVYWDGSPVDRGTFTISEDLIVWSKSGSNPEGTYQWSLDGDVLTLTVVNDPYEDRMLVCTTKPLIKK